MTRLRREHGYGFYLLPANGLIVCRSDSGDDK